LRARAIENQCYVVAAAQFGQHNPKRASYGHALIIDPWGEILQVLCMIYFTAECNAMKIKHKCPRRILAPMEAAWELHKSTFSGSKAFVPLCRSAIIEGLPTNFAFRSLPDRKLC
jgi:hypothetical protein